VLGTQNTPQGMTTLSISQLEARRILHWLQKGMQQRCCVFHEKKAEQDNLQMPKIQCGIVCCAMFQDLSHALKILRPTPHWRIM